KGELIILNHDFASFCGDFEPVGAWRLPCRSGEYRGHSIRILKISSHVVFGFDIVIAAEMAKRADAGRHSKDPLEQLQIVRTLVKQDASSFAFPGRSPVARLIVGFGSEPIGDRPTNTSDRSQVTGLHQSPELQKKRIRTLVEHRGKYLIRTLMSRQQTFS